MNYLIRVLRHKWFVFLEAFRLGIPFLGIIHDLSKFLPDEFFAYAQYDFGAINSEVSQIKFDLAWLKHQKRNKHHWQYWLLINDAGDAGYECPYIMKQVEPQLMPEKYVREMVADWRGAGRAYGNPDTIDWYIKNKHKIVLHPDSRVLAEQLLEYYSEGYY